MALLQKAAFLALASYASAQGNYGGYSGGNPYQNGGDSSSGSSGFDFEQYIPSKAITAHAVLAALAFVILFPSGGILIRLGSFRGLWLVHGLLQIFAYIVYIAAFGIGIWMVKSAPAQAGVWHNAHPIIGTILFVVLFFQPFLGFLHHIMFKKHSRRVVWSYGHIWLGRIIITLGIINGGLGLRWAKMTRFAAPSNGAVIAYAVIAAIMWLVYVASAIYGEIKRSRTRKNAAPLAYKEERGSDADSDTAPGAPHGVGEYYKNHTRGQQYA